MADTSTYFKGSTLDPTQKRLDASYQYYLHGPLARMELGDSTSKVQGVDYAYTLQGWLKGVNSQILRASLDMGHDSLIVAKDAYGYSLGYYHNDYKPIGGSSYVAFVNQYTQNTGDITGQSLYNGNISTSTVAISQLNSGNPVGYTYHYDQLNRIKELRQHSGIISWSHSNINSVYSENFIYDGNGNILSLLRAGSVSTSKDSLLYQYNRDVNGRLTNNKLNWLNGVGNATNFGTPQYANNYRFDPIGNMSYDRQDSITNVNWSVYGKIQSITDSGKTISYVYNTAQERIAKTANSLTIYYLRDAQGNAIAVYDNKSGHINWREQHLYGSSRLGMWLSNVNVATDSASFVWDTIGHKRYELNNHLGNVLTTITDKQVVDTSGLTHYYTADISTAQDYYAFGALMPSRIFTEDDYYRYGFNGKENDNEVKGIGNQQDYGMRIYDPRVGSFLSVDPMMSKFPEFSSYQFSGDNAIMFIDMDGTEPQIPYFDKFKWGDNVVLNVLKTIPNTCTNLVNGGIYLVNATIYDGHEIIFNTSQVPTEIKNEGVNDYHSASRTVSQAIKYHTKTPIKQQLKDAGNTLVSAQNLENTLTLGASLFAGGETPTIASAPTEVSIFSKVENILNVTLKGSLKDFKDVPGVYVHEFDSETVYVGQAKDLSVRSKTSLTELLDKVKHKGTAAKAGDTYSGKTIFIKLEGSGAKNLNDLENKVLSKYGGTKGTPGSRTYNIRKVPGS